MAGGLRPAVRGAGRFALLRRAMCGCSGDESGAGAWPYGRGRAFALPSTRSPARAGGAACVATPAVSVSKRRRAAWHSSVRGRWDGSSLMPGSGRGMGGRVGLLGGLLGRSVR